MRPISAQLQQSLLDPAGTARVIVEARNESVADLRQRADQWAAADGGLSANLEVLADGGLRLKATAGAASGSTVQNAWYRARETGTTKPFIDPIGGPADNNAEFVGILGQWTGTAANVAYSSVQAWLNPRFDTTKPKVVQTWECIVYQITTTWAQDAQSNPVIGLVPILRVQVPAVGEAAGWVAFPFQDTNGKSTPWHPDPFVGAPFNPEVSSQLTQQYFVVCHGYDAKGQKCTNIAWGYDNAHSSFVTGSGNNTVTLAGRSVKLIVGGVSDYLLTAGEVLFPGTTTGIPAFQFIPVTYAATATATFKTGTPLDLGAAPASAALIEFAVKRELPAGTSVTAEVALDPAGSFVAFKDGQTAADVALAAQRKYDIRVTLTANAGADRTPIVRLLGARVVAKADLGDVAEVTSLTEQTDPITHKSEVEQAVIRVLHDGERDYRDAISLLLSQNPPGQLSYRVFVGDRKLSKDLWMHHDDYYPDDEQLEDAFVDLINVSCLSQLKQEMPVLTSDAVAAPVADSSNPGAWTASTGSVLYPQIADLPEPPWAATTAYLVGQRIVDANSNVQVCTVAGTSGGGAPTWNTGVGGFTIDSGVTWQNVGPVLSGLPDDTTYIQSPSNPANADYIVTLGAIGTPQQSVGATIQFRAATAAGGQSLSCSVILREGTTVRATKTVTVNVADTGQGSYTPVQYLLTAAEQAAIGNWSNLNFLIRANGTGQIRVGWARLVVLGRRVPYVSSSVGTSPQAIMDDILNNVIALDGRLKGQQYVNPSPALSVAKTIEQSPSGGTDLSRAQAELEALAWITGTFYMSTQGKLTNRPLYQVTTGADLITGTTTAIYAPLTGPIRAIFERNEVEPISITPGWRQRIPLYRVPWGWNGRNYAGEAQVVNAPALSYYRQAMIEADMRCPAEVSQWIPTDGLARGLSARHGQSFGLGLMVWRFRSTYRRPELERGDVVTFATDRFLGYDPIATRALAGKMWATGVIVGRYDADGREFAVWIQSLSAIRPVAGTLAIPPFSSSSPMALGVAGYIGEAAGTTAGDNLNVFWAGTPAVAAVKIAVSTSGPPAAGTGTLFVGNSGTALMVGPYAFGTTIYVTITPYATVDGSQAAGVAAVVVKLIDGSSISTPYNSQGSVLPTPISSMKAIWDARGQANGHMWAAFGWGVIGGGGPAALTMYRPDGTSLSIPHSDDTAIIPGFVPSLSQVAGGALGARTRFARIGLVKDGIVYYAYNAVSTHDESSFAISANNLLKIASPSVVAGYDGWCPLVGLTSGTEVTQPGTIVTPIAFGTDWTEPAGGAQTSNATNTPFDVNFWLGRAVLTELTASTSYYLYPYWDPSVALVRFKYATAPDPASAAVQYGDGKYPMTTGSILISVPAAAGTATGQPPGPGAAGGNTKLLT